jgi:hypothetical protein
VQTGILFALAAYIYGEYYRFTGKPWVIFLLMKFYVIGLSGRIYFYFSSFFSEKTGVGLKSN